MLPITNIIEVSVNQAATGLGAFNVNNVMFLTTDPFLSNPESDVFRAYADAQSVGTDFGTGTETYRMAVALFSQQPNILAGGGNLLIAPRVSTETLLTAIARVAPLVYFVGIISNFYPSVQADMLTLANAVQAYGNKMLIFPQSSASGAAPLIPSTGIFAQIVSASDNGTRCLYYTSDDADARLYAAAYAGRGFSVNFDGQNTVLTMNLKQLATIPADEAINQTIYNEAEVVGADVYPDISGVPGVISNGANKFFDQIYNLIWFVGAIQVAGFNALAQAATKVPQTEPGVSALADAYRSVCQKAVVNGYLAPGTWTAPQNTFGVQADFYSNIQNLGYYIYHQPVALQSAADRAARKAPLFQIAIKEAGGINSSSIIVNVNA